MNTVLVPSDPAVPGIVRQTMVYFKELRDDSNLLKALRSLSHTSFETELLAMCEAMADLRSFDHYLYSLQLLKSRCHRLTAEGETTFVSRCEQSAKSATAFIDSASRIDRLFEESGLGPQLAPNGSRLFYQFPYNPYYGSSVVDLLRGIGITEELVSGARELDDPDWSWNLMTVHDNDGSFSGLIDRAADHLTIYHRRAERANTDGVAAIEGGWPALAVIVVVVVVVVVCAVVSSTGGHCGVSGGATVGGTF
jgi:hypothetical protein